MRSPLSLPDEGVLQLAYSIVRAFAEGRDPPLPPPPMGGLVAQLAYSTATAVVAVAADMAVIRRYAEWAAHSAYRHMAREAPGRLRLYGAWLGVAVRDARQVAPPLAEAYPHAVKFTDYIRYRPEAPEWAPINRPVVRGWVLLRRGELPRLLKEVYREAVLADARRAADDPIFAGRLKALVPGEVAEALGRLKDRYSAVAQVRSTGPWPPCMAGLWDALRRGENLPHTARFALASFLLAVGWDVDRVVDAFRAVPDFDEKVTRYQVQHIAGQAGGRKRYSVPNCQTLNGWGLCPGPCGARHPLRRKEATG